MLQESFKDLIKDCYSEDQRAEMVLELAGVLGVADKVVSVTSAETIAQDIAKDLTRTVTVKHGDLVMTERGQATAVVLTPEEVVRRLN